MPEYRAIEIDIDVHKAIESERRSFDERPNEALRRLLGLPVREQDLRGKRAAAPSEGRPWTGEGVTLPHGTKVRMTYNKVSYSGEIADGRWIVEGKAYDSPSGAASGVGRTKNGKRTRLDGWIYWQAHLPGEDGWRPLSHLRPESRLTAEELLQVAGLDNASIHPAH